MARHICRFSPSREGRAFALKRWHEETSHMDFATLVYNQGEYSLYSEDGKLLDFGGPRVPMQAIENGWVAD